MFYLHASNRTENLLRQLATLIEIDPLESLFDQEIILIQSQGMERMISQYMADYFSVWCSYQYLLPTSFLHTIAEKLGREFTPDGYERNYLTWRIDDKLQSIEEDVYSPLQNYLQGSTVELKRFQLARQLANLFDQYQLMRPQMLKNWEKGIGCFDDGAEAWQMDLWKRLVAERDRGRQRGELLSSVISGLQSLHNPAFLPKRVSVFGVHILPPIFIDYLQGLSQHCDIHLFLLSPCKNYWGDMKRRNPVGGEAGSVDNHHPLLNSLGRQGRDFQDLLLDKIDFQEEFTSYDDPLIDSPKQLMLHKLQADLLLGEVRQSTGSPKEDGSIRIVSCHSKQRELEILKDHVLDILNMKSELRLRDIVVMAPDIQDYAPFIPAVFRDIQHSIADRSLQRRNAYAALFEEFFSLLSGRFGWAEVLDFLGKEQVYPQFGLSQGDLEIIQRWVVDSGTRWGLSAESRKKFGSSFHENSWQAGLERLLMGYAIDYEGDVEEILPYTDIEGGDNRILGGLCEFIDTLQRAENDFSVHQTLKQWSASLLKYCRILFGSHEEKEYLELSEILRNLEKYGEVNDGKKSLLTIKNWFETATKESRSASGFLKGHLTFCSMLPHAFHSVSCCLSDRNEFWRFSQKGSSFPF